MKREETKFLLDTINNSIIQMDNVQESMLSQFRNGKEPGSKTYISDIDKIMVNGSNGSFAARAWSWRQGEVNLWTGYNNEGKSQFLIFLCVLKAINEDKKFAFFSPENFPPDDFFDDMIHTILGKTTDRKSKHFDVQEYEYLEAINRIKNNFFFVYPQENSQPDFRIEKIEEVFSFLIMEHDIFAVIVDPYIKIRHEMMPGEPEHLYASRFMMDRVNFTRRENVSYNLVMHQTTPRREKGDKNYPKPNLYSIKGGGTFSDSADNVLTIWRPNRGSDPLSTEVTFISEKIKKQKLVGIPFEVEMDFDRRTNRYKSPDGTDYLDGNNRKIIDSVKPYTNDVFKNIEPAPF